MEEGEEKSLTMWFDAGDPALPAWHSEMGTDLLKSPSARWGLRGWREETMMAMGMEGQQAVVDAIQKKKAYQCYSAATTGILDQKIPGCCGKIYAM